LNISADSGRGIYSFSNSSDGVAGVTNTPFRAGIYGWSKNGFGYSGYFEGGKFIVDSSMGVGVKIPTAKLDVNGSLRANEIYEGIERVATTSYVDSSRAWTKSGSDIYYDLGNVGIGTTIPNVPLHIERSIDGGDVGTVISNSFVGSGSTDETASILFSFPDTGAGIYAGKESDFTSGLNRDGYLSLWTNNDNSFTEKLRVTANGNIGIGTTTPGANLHIKKDGNQHTTLLVENDQSGSAATSTIYVTSGNSGGAISYYSPGYSEAGRSHFADRVSVNADSLTGGLNLMATANGGDIQFFTGGDQVINERMRVNSAGNVGIGTTTPTTNLHIVADSRGMQIDSKYPEIIFSEVDQPEVNGKYWRQVVDSKTMRWDLSSNQGFTPYTTPLSLDSNGDIYTTGNIYAATPILNEHVATKAYVDSSDDVNDADADPNNELPIAGTGISVSTRTVSVDSNYVQRRVSSSCAAGSSIRAIAVDGTVTCETDDAGSSVTKSIPIYDCTAAAVSDSKCPGTCTSSLTRETTCVDEGTYYFPGPSYCWGYATGKQTRSCPLIGYLVQ